MKGDILVIEEHHYEVAKQIVESIIGEIKKKSTRYIITVAGESGSGKSETGKAIADELKKHSVESAILSQDDYFFLPPKSNDAMRRKDPEWLGPHIEVKLDQLESNIKDAVNGKDSIIKPLVDYNENSIGEEIVSLTGIKVVIAEGTYTTLLKNVDCKVFISRNRLDTLEHRKARNRGNEIGDSFIEQILIIEHKIIAGHKQLADFIINKDYSLISIK